MSLAWDDIAAFALSLPGTELSTSYGRPAVKINGRAFVTSGREAGSFCLMIDLDTVEMLKETDPETYWQSPHYEGWPAVLVRYDGGDPDRMMLLIERAWRDRASSRQREEHGAARP